MDASASVGLVALVAGVCGALCLAVPSLIGWLPEPEPEPEPEPGGEARPATGSALPEEGPKELYADIAARPGLRWASVLAGAGVGALLALALGRSWSLAVWVPLVPLLLALGYIDWRTRLLPTKLMQPAYAVALLGIGVAWLGTHQTGDLLRAGVGWLIAGFVFVVMWFINPRGMGYGDVRLSGVLGLALGHLGWGELFVGLYSSFLVFGLPGLLLALLRWNRALLKTAFPFGPFMMVGALIGVLWGQPLWARLVGA